MAEPPPYVFFSPVGPAKKKPAGKGGFRLMIAQRFSRCKKKLADFHDFVTPYSLAR